MLVLLHVHACNSIYLLNNKKINPVAANEFSWEQISEAHSGMENAKFTGKTYINISD